LIRVNVTPDIDTQNELQYSTENSNPYRYNCLFSLFLFRTYFVEYSFPASMLTQRQKENISMATELTRIASKKLQDAGKISLLGNSNQHSRSNKGGFRFNTSNTSYKCVF